MLHDLQVEEYKERMFAGSEASQAMREIRTRDASFDMNIFLRSIKVSAAVHPIHAIHPIYPIHAILACLATGRTAP